MRNKILIVGTLYSLLIGVLKNDLKKTKIVLCNKVSINIEKIPDICISKLYLQTDKKFMLIRYYIEYLRMYLYLSRLKKEEIFTNSYLLENIFLNNSFNIIEDGLADYGQQVRLKITLKKIIKLDFRKIIFGDSQKIKKIYLTGIAPIPEKIQNKVELINLKELWNKKTLKEQNEILDIFSFDLGIKEKIKGRNLILFTQPLSEDNVLTEEEKIEIYLKIIKKYSKDRLIIKTHPREKTNYKDIFKEYVVLDNPFPFEILNLLGVKFNKAITLFSTAALGLGKEVEVDFYGTEVHPKILKRFGSCNNIMKRNCFLKEE